MKHRLILGAAIVMATALLPVGSAHALQPNVRWDYGSAEIEAPPFLVSLDLPDYSKPSQFRRGAVVRVDVEVETESDVCEWNLVITPTLNDNPIGAPIVLVGEGSYDFDDGTVRLSVNSAGTYALRLEGAVRTPTPLCREGSSVVTPYLTSIELFTFDQAPPNPASTAKVAITSSGPHTLVANTRSRSRQIGLTFRITDPQKRKDLFYSICMRDTSDCWIEDAKLVPGAATKRTSTGWIRTWGFWWERSSPSSCASYYWRQPDVSVILVVSNADGKVVGRKKHGVKLTCRS
jgi:hypothetical protein